MVFQLSTQGKPPAQRGGIGLFLVVFFCNITTIHYQVNWDPFELVMKILTFIITNHQLEIHFWGAKDPAILQRPPGRLAHPERRTPEALLFWSAATAPEQHLDEHYPPNADLQVLKRWVK